MTFLKCSTRGCGRENNLVLCAVCDELVCPLCARTVAGELLCPGCAPDTAPRVNVEQGRLIK